VIRSRMAKAPRPWIVTPHDPLEKIDENLWALSSPVPGLPFPRRMSMVRLADGRIVFLDAVPMDEPTLAEIRAWGTPSILVVTNGYHRTDVHAFRDKLGLKVLTPEKSDARVRQMVGVDGHLDALPADPTLAAEPLVGVTSGEAVFTVRSPAGGVTLVFSDGVMNVRRKLGWLPRLLGFHGGPKAAPLFKLKFVKDKPGLRAQYERLAETPALARLVMSHGDTVDTGAAGALRAAAATI
jgi:hypothetical protein